MATGMTDTIRSSDMAYRLSGKVYVNSTLIHVRWPWIVRPVASVILSVALLGATAASSRKSHVSLRKSSFLPYLVGQLETHPDHNLGRLIDNVDEMEDTSRKIQIVMEGCDPLVFAQH
ncbi:hypothetical protein N7471_009885 [Penicillium samsonianum]|uniref:uncharacterized protein n=1 Tax=Penicillium samsonianum TaxID=1882272 RepID=UPI0025483C24|nr:uncharacterized protein N7471_009885 [Penicillium samsonianum]KAJ6128668.1 hypothetical protein N7471_009885 [Penicillium samsonianum]